MADIGPIFVSPCTSPPPEDIVKLVKLSGGTVSILMHRKHAIPTTIFMHTNQKLTFSMPYDLQMAFVQYFWYDYRSPPLHEEHVYALVKFQPKLTVFKFPRNGYWVRNLRRFQQKYFPPHHSYKNYNVFHCI